MFGDKVFIIAELSGNHHHDYDKALALIDAAADAGVDAVKVQTYTPDTITLPSDSEYFQVKVNDAWKGMILYQLYEKAYTPWDWQPKLKEYAESKGLVFFSSPFDETAVDFLERMYVQLYKVASFEIGHIPLLKKIASTKKPVIVSRGMSTEEEIELAITTLKENGCPEIALLHCISSYPAVAQEMNLNTIPYLKEKFGVRVGLSDHSLGIYASLGAVALGAQVLEKHMIMDRNEGGPDSQFSLNKDEFKELVDNVRNLEQALGTVAVKTGSGESENKNFRPSIWVTKDVKAGDVISLNNIIIRRPGYGMAPKYFEGILGKKYASDAKKYDPLTKDLIE